jgi:hypothetical protein
MSGDELGADVLGLRPVVRPIALIELFVMAIGCPRRVTFRRLRLGSTPADRELGRQGDPQLRGPTRSPRGAGPAGGVDLPVVTPEQAAAAARGGEVEVVASRWLGRVGHGRRIGCGSGWASARRSGGRPLDVEVAERVVFALVAQRAPEPASKPAATRWVVERVVIDLQPRATARTPTSSRARGTITPNDTSA